MLILLALMSCASLFSCYPSVDITGVSYTGTWCAYGAVQRIEPGPLEGQLTVICECPKE